MSAIPWLYVDADMDHQCSNCHAEPNEYCRRPDGVIRRIPCIKRMPVVENAYLGEQLDSIGAPQTVSERS